MLDIVSSNNPVQYQGKLMIQTCENGKKPSSLRAQFWNPKNVFHEFYLYETDIVLSYDPIQFHQKQMNQTWENGEKPDFGPNFGPFDPNLWPQFFFISYSSASS